MSLHESAIAFENVRKSFGTRTILDGVTFEVPKGRSIAILGRSGTGKSVSLKLMIGLLTPDSGKVEVLGKQPAQLDSAGMSGLRKRMGFAPVARALRPSVKIASASTVAVVVPSPATSLVFEETSLTMRAPMFS